MHQLFLCDLLLAAIPPSSSSSSSSKKEHKLICVSSIQASLFYFSQVELVESQLSEYLTKFRNRLSASNRRYIEQMVVVVKALLAYIRKSSGIS